MTDEIHEGIMSVKLRNKAVTGKPYEMNNLIGNIKVAVEQLEEVASILDFSNTSVKVRRDENNNDIIVFEFYVKGVIIGDVD